MKSLWMREEIGLTGRSCGLCASAEVAIVRCQEVRRGLAWLNPGWAPRVRVYERCRSCSAKQAVQALQPA